MILHLWDGGESKTLTPIPSATLWVRDSLGRNPYGISASVVSNPLIRHKPLNPLNL